MEEKRSEFSVSSTETAIHGDPERTLASPRFDEKSIQKAQPAVPLTRGGINRGKPRRAWPTSIIVLCLFGGLALGALGGLALTLRQRDGDERAELQPAPQAHATEVAPPVVETSPAAPSSAPPGLEVKVAPNEGASVATERAQSEKTATANAERAPDPAIKDASVADDRGAVAADEATQGELRAALGDWLAATNARDVGRQMQFYAPKMNAFYLSRNTPRESVRAEKSRLFARASTVDVRASSAPDIRLSHDGQTAVMRFRKRYQIGGAGARSGEVLQELRWRRTASGWRIISERDLRVLQ